MLGIGKILPTVKSMYLISGVAMITYTDYTVFVMLNLVMFLSFKPQLKHRNTDNCINLESLR